VTQVPDFSKTVLSFETSEITNLATQCNTPEDLKPKLHPVRTIFTTDLPNAKVQVNSTYKGIQNEKIKESMEREFWD
jgi:hypothetical protein